MDFERDEGEKREGRFSTVWGRSGWWMIEEREGGGKRGFLLLWPHGLTPGVTGQTGDGHRSDRWPPLVETESSYRFFRPTLGRTEDLDKIQERVLIGRTDTTSVVPILFFLFEILLLKTSPKML
jgi:hypothetical protein